MQEQNKKGIKLEEKLEQLNIDAKGLGDAISEALVKAILDGILKEEEQLIESDIQMKFGVRKMGNAILGGSHYGFRSGRDSLPCACNRT